MNSSGSTSITVLAPTTVPANIRETLYLNEKQLLNKVEF